MKPLIMDLPYPSTDKLCRDVKAGNIISFAYATLRGEVTATLQYVFTDSISKAQTRRTPTR